jgi:hypothetical protein
MAVLRAITSQSIPSQRRTGTDCFPAPVGQCQKKVPCELVVRDSSSWRVMAGWPACLDWCRGNVRCGTGEGAGGWRVTAAHF